MSNRETIIKSISDYFGKIEIQIRNLNHQNLNDLNIISEKLVNEILNIVFDYNLTNNNSRHPNFPSVELIDDKNRIAVQVTSDKSKKKIQKTIENFHKNNFGRDYDRLIVFILGEKQKSYPNLIIPPETPFNPKEDIIDFKTLLRFVSNLNLNKLNQIIQFLQSELSEENKRLKLKTSFRIKFKQSQAIKKKIEKHLLKKISTEMWKTYVGLLEFEPSYRFIYRSLNIRSIDDKSYPERTFNKEGFANWMTLELWDFYPYGLEFVVLTPKQIIIEKDNSWRFAKKNENKALNCCRFLRIPYDHIIEYDPDTNEYNGYPTIFVEYSNDGSPFEKEIYGLIGYYKRGDIQQSRRAVYLGEIPGNCSI